MTASLADVDGDAGALVLVVFDGFDFALADRHVVAESLGYFGVGGGRAVGGGVVDDQTRKARKPVAGIAELGGGHGFSRAGSRRRAYVFVRVKLE